MPNSPHLAFNSLVSQIWLAKRNQVLMDLVLKHQHQMRLGEKDLRLAKLVENNLVVLLEDNHQDLDLAQVKVNREVVGDFLVLVHRHLARQVMDSFHVNHLL